MFNSSGWLEYFYYKKLAEREKIEREKQRVVDKQQALIDSIRTEVTLKKAS